MSSPRARRANPPSDTAPLPTTPKAKSAVLDRHYVVVGLSDRLITASTRLRPVTGHDHETQLRRPSPQLRRNTLYAQPVLRPSEGPLGPGLRPQELLQPRPQEPPATTEPPGGQLAAPGQVLDRGNGHLQPPDLLRPLEDPMHQNQRLDPRARRLLHRPEPLLDQRRRHLL